MHGLMEEANRRVVVYYISPMDGRTCMDIDDVFEMTNAIRGRRVFYSTVCTAYYFS